VGFFANLALGVLQAPGGAGARSSLARARRTRRHDAEMFQSQRRVRQGHCSA